MSERVVAIVSGGMDSVTMLKMLVDQGKDVLVMNFSYGSKHNEKERAALRRICQEMCLSLYTYDLPLEVELQVGYDHKTNLLGTEMVNLLASNLLKSGEDVPDGHYEEENMKKTVVPFRNGIMLSVAVGFAESHGASAVYYGNHAGDNTNYPDCRPAFVEAMGQAAVLGTFQGIEIRSPFVHLTKSDIAAKGIQIGAPLDIAWSCYRGQERPCLRCCTCVERIWAFHSAGLRDPQLTDAEWEDGVANMLKVEADFQEKKARREFTEPQDDERAS